MCTHIYLSTYLTLLKFIHVVAQTSTPFQGTEVIIANSIEDISINQLVADYYILIGVLGTLLSDLPQI